MCSLNVWVWLFFIVHHVCRQLIMFTPRTIFSNGVLVSVCTNSAYTELELAAMNEGVPYEEYEDDEEDERDL